jgi:excinuclease ABC subunit A
MRTAIRTLFVLDEPSIGLHPHDNGRLIQILKSLKDIGNTVMVVEHDPEVIASAEHLIDLGPRAGEPRGEVIAQGPPEELVKSKKSITARYLKKHL